MRQNVSICHVFLPLWKNLLEIVAQIVEKCKIESS